MYGFWYIVIGLLVILAVAIITLILYYKTKLFNRGNLNLIAITVIIITTIMLCCSSLFAICDPIYANKEYLKFKENRTAIEQFYENGGTSDSTALRKAVTNSNQWLIKAKANKKKWGCFSEYYYIDVENIDIIFLKN